MGSGLWPEVKRRVSRRLGMGSSEELGEQKSRNGQWTLARSEEKGEQKTRNGQQ